MLIRFYCPFLPNSYKGNLTRGRIYSSLFKKCGYRLQIASNFIFFSPETVSIGNDVFIGHNCYLGAGEIRIEDNVMIGPFASIMAGNHLFENGIVLPTGNKYQYGHVVIGKGSWIGAHVCVTANVIVGQGCLVSAGAVVTKNIPDFCMVAGVPAKFIRENKS